MRWRPATLKLPGGYSTDLRINRPQEAAALFENSQVRSTGDARMHALLAASHLINHDSEYAQRELEQVPPEARSHGWLPCLIVLGAVTMPGTRTDAHS